MIKRKSLALLTPLAALLCSAVLPTLLALRIYLRLKAAAHGAATVTFGSPGYQFTVQTEHLLSFAFGGMTLVAEGPIRAIHAPAFAMHLLLSLLISGTSNWQPASVLTSTWVVLVFPLYALPAWWFVGRGLDGLLARKHIRVVEMVISSVLVAVFLGLSGMLRFGMSPAEREGRAEWYIYGFAFWGVLISTPLLGWLRQKLRGEQTGHE